jgi:multiple sugar transport system substrate-binding protein
MVSSNKAPSARASRTSTAGAIPDSGPTARFVGLTWDHPRGYRALAAAAAKTEGLIVWRTQPLEGFESHPIADLAAAYDLLVLDHPHIGEAVAQACLLPLEDFFTAREIAAWGEQVVGAAMDSYLWRGRHWALPLDVATQVMAFRPDLIDEPIDAWQDVLEIARRKPVALSIAGPHAILGFFSLCLAEGTPLGGADLVDDAAGVAALERLHQLYAGVPKGSDRLNPIELLRAMAEGNDIALVPLVFGYVNYASPAPGLHRVAFAEAPRGSKNRGSVLGGTGIALTGRTMPDAALLDHLRWLMSDQAQLNFIPRHDGQPSSRRAWRDGEVNAGWGDFYRATLETTERAWVRPRFDGYVAFQNAAAELVRAALEAREAPRLTLEKVRGVWRDAAAPSHTFTSSSASSTRSSL